VDVLVVIHPAEEGGWWAKVPTLPGCFAQGETVDETPDDARGAISSHIEPLREDGQSIPDEQLVVTSVRVA
jgi:predicted RNase H-like HicB family nuclease